MNTKITCRFGSQEALDEFNKRNGFDLTKLTKSFDVHTKKKVERKPSKGNKVSKSDRDWWKPYWWGMPMYESHDAPPPYATVDFAFDEADLDYANKVFDQNISEKTKSVWFPKLVPGWYSALRVVGGSSEHRYPIYVISKGRAEKCYTSRFLTQMEVKHFVVCEPQEYPEYKQHVENQYATLIQLDMTYKDKYDTCDDMDPSFPKGSGPARNFCWDDSIKRGYKWHWLMDDNATEGFHWFWHNVKVKCRTGAILAACEDFVDRYENIAIFGPAYKMFCLMDCYYPPFITNTRIYSCLLIRNDIADQNGVPFRWRARFNEDTDLSLRVLKAGWCTVQSNWFLFGKSTTMKVKGGNTTSIYVNGTKEKSEMIAKLHPDVAKVVWKFNRWHHEVNYSVFKQELKLKPGVVPTQGDNNYGMRVIMTEETETYDTKAYLAEKYKDAPDYVYDINSSSPTTNPNMVAKKAEVAAVEKSSASEKAENLRKIETPPSEKAAPVENIETPASEPEPKKMFDLAVDGIEGIDPRTLGKMMIEFTTKGVPLRILHGQFGEEDIVVKLCEGLSVPWMPLRDASGFVMPKHKGKPKLAGFRDGSPTFTKVD